MGIVVKQNEEYNCGAAALGSIIKYYKGFVPEEIISVDTLTNKNGTTFYHLKEAAIKYGFECFGYYVEDVAKIKTPSIVQLNINGLFHFVVVYKIDSKIEIMDPAFGYKKMDIISFKKLFTGYYLYLTPISSIMYYKPNTHIKEKIILFIKRNSKNLVITLVMSLLLVIISIFNTYLLKLIINYSTYKYIYIFCLIIIFKLLINFIKNINIAQLNKKFSNSIINKYIEHFFSLPFKYLQLKGAGEITSRISDLYSLKDFFSKEIINVIIYFLFMICSFIMLFFLNTNITYILLILSFLYMVTSFILDRRIYREYLNLIDSETNFMDKTIECINNIIQIKTLNKNKYFYEKIKTLNLVNNDNYFKLEKLLNYNDLLINLYNDLGLLIILITSILNKMTLDNVFIYIMIFNYYSESIKYYMNLIPNLMYFKGIYNKVQGILYIDKEKTLEGLKVTNGDIIINDLFYKINFNVIFNNFNLTIKKGNKVLVKGNNGSGKSTLLNILYLLIEDYTGLISIDGVDIRKVSKNDLRNNISYVSQNDSLFADSIINNVILDLEYDKDKFSKISKLLYLDEILNKKCNGYNSIIKNNLSGGERQRVILARAIYQGFNYLFLDEALSEVSYNLRKKIIKNINIYFKDKTIIYVSHFNEDYLFDQIIDLTARKDNYVRRL